MTSNTEMCTGNDSRGVESRFFRAGVRSPKFSNSGVGVPQKKDSASLDDVLSKEAVYQETDSTQ